MPGSRTGSGGIVDFGVYYVNVKYSPVAKVIVKTE